MHTVVGTADLSPVVSFGWGRGWYHGCWLCPISMMPHIPSTLPSEQPGSRVGPASRLDALSKLAEAITGSTCIGLPSLLEALGQSGFVYSLEDLTRLIQSPSRGYERLREQLRRIAEAPSNRARDACRFVEAVMSNEGLVASVSEASDRPPTDLITVGNLVSASRPFLPDDAAPKARKRSLNSLSVGSVPILSAIEHSVPLPIPEGPNPLLAPPLKESTKLLGERLKELNLVACSAKTSLETLGPFVSATHGSGGGVPVTDGACDQLASLQEDTKGVLLLARASEGGIATQQAAHEAATTWETAKVEVGHCWADAGRLAEMLR